MNVNAGPTGLITSAETFLSFLRYKDLMVHIIRHDLTLLQEEGIRFIKFSSFWKCSVSSDSDYTR